MKFEELSKINVNGHTEDKNGLTYLSWVWAWSEFKKQCPEADYEIIKQENGLPYVFDENTGYMVYTKATDGKEWKEMWLPVMDGNNKAMLNHEYTYSVKVYENGRFTGQYEEKTVKPATMFDVNKTIMRCLVKNLAMFGLGIYIYAGEDYPEGYEISKEEALKTIVPFGKYKGKTLDQIINEENNPDYLQWVLEYDGASEGLKNACSVLVQPITDESVKLLADFEHLLVTTETDRDAIYEHYGVKSSRNMSVEQLKEANAIMEKKGK